MQRCRAGVRACTAVAPAGRARSPCRVEVHVLCVVPGAPCAISSCAICRCELCAVLEAARTPTLACPACLG